MTVPDVWEKEGKRGGEIPIAEYFLFTSHSWVTTSSVHLPSVFLSCVSLPLVCPCACFLSLILSHISLAHASKCLQHPALYLQSMWDEMCPWDVCVCIVCGSVCTCVTSCVQMLMHVGSFECFFLWFVYWNIDSSTVQSMQLPNVLLLYELTK